MSVWSETTLLRVAELVEQGRTARSIGKMLGLTYTEAKRYVQRGERRQALPYVYVRRTMKTAPVGAGA